jgi:type IV secretion system protein TrbG
LKQTAIILMAGALLAGCAVQQPAPLLMPAELTNPAPAPVHVPDDPLNALSPAIREAYLSGAARPVRDGISWVFPYEATARPTIYTSPLHLTEIVLADNEHLTNAAIGDSDRFELDARGQRILIKPTPGGHGQGGGNNGNTTVMLPLSYSTNLVAETDRRSYHFIIQSTPHTWMEQVRFFYPDEITAAREARAAAMRKAAQQTAQASTAESLSFDYRIDGPNVPWRPTQVYRDASHTYIEFSKGAAMAGDLPALFSGQGTVVNYTTNGSTYIADRVLTEAALVEGQGRNREVVRIESTDGH